MIRIRDGRFVWGAFALACAATLLVGCGSGVPAEGFRVEVVPADAYVSRSQAASFLVTVERDEGFSGPIALALTSGPVGIAATGTVDAGANEGELLVTVGSDVSLGPAVLHLVADGRASGGAALRENVDFVVIILDETRPTRYLIDAAGSSPPAEIYEEVVVPDEGSPWLLELVVLGGTLVLDPDGSYQHLLTLDTWKDGSIVGRNRWADHGVWMEVRAGMTFTSTWIDGHAFTGTRSGSDVALAFDLHPFVGTHAVVELVFGE